MVIDIYWVRENYRHHGLGELVLGMWTLYGYICFSRYPYTVTVINGLWVLKKIVKEGVNTEEEGRRRVKQH